MNAEEKQLRNHYAGLAMQAIMRDAIAAEKEGNLALRNTAITAFGFANAMIERRRIEDDLETARTNSEEPVTTNEERPKPF